ncbi:MAG: amidohydrolase [Bacteroidetes bacterium]|nr:amidohydrolase [Bacteroidota bacterium]MBU1117239.1 amidohydrolase [Bacteroidota bacterium]MBU1800303.1 amidohydrolase [Bacteroidota bacterium]
MNKHIFSFLGIILIILTACEPKDDKSPDLVLINGNIATLDENIPKVEAIAIKADTIQDLGTNKSIKDLIGKNTKVIDLKGKFVMPGFFESHAHFLSLGESKLELDLSKATNWDEIIVLVAQAAEKAHVGEWIVARGWHQEKWHPIPAKNIDGYPIHTVLSTAIPFNPVLLYHASGHALFANLNAMDLAKIDTSTENPTGGRIIRDSLKNAIGVFEEEAMSLISNVYNNTLAHRSPKEIKAYKEKIVNLAVEECLKNGITSFEDAGSTFEEIDFLKEIVDSGKLPIRLNVMIYEDNEALKEKISNYKIINYGNNHLTVRAIKTYIDGALGSRGAWMFEDYDDLPNHKGLNVTSLNTITETANIAIENGFQLCTHAIGDRGNNEILNIYEKAFEQNPDKKDLRWRVEHAQHLDRTDIPRFVKLGVIAAMQGVHATSDATFVIKRLGHERAKRGAYVWRKLIDSGAIICNGTDAPVERVNTIENYFSSVTRQLSDSSAFFPEEKMTRIEALNSYTINGAYASFQDDKLGSLKIGKLADLTILSNDITTIADENLRNTQVEMTIVGGKVVFTKQ